MADVAVILPPIFITNEHDAQIRRGGATLLTRCPNRHIIESVRASRTGDKVKWYELPEEVRRG